MSDELGLNKIFSGSRKKNYSTDGIMMGKTISSALCLGSIIGVSGGQLLAQLPIALQPLQPASTTEPGGMHPLPPPPPMATPKGLITLEKIPPVEHSIAARPVSSPMKVMPLKLENSLTHNEGQSVDSKLNVNDMVRNQIDPANMFSKIRLESSPPVPVPLASMVRYQKTPGMGEFEWTPSGYCWQSPAFCYCPLYFEQPNLERYGNSTVSILVPAVSAAYFFGQVTLFPIKSICQKPWSKSCTLGHHRPGDCAPFQRRNPNHVHSTQTPFQSVPVQEVILGSEATVESGGPLNLIDLQNQVDQASAVSTFPPTAKPISVRIFD